MGAYRFMLGGNQSIIFLMVPFSGFPPIFYSSFLPPEGGCRSICLIALASPRINNFGSWEVWVEGKGEPEDQ